MDFVLYPVVAANARQHAAPSSNEPPAANLTPPALDEIGQRLMSPTG
jgi:hypothetical protein